MDDCVENSGVDYGGEFGGNLGVHYGCSSIGVIF